MTTKRASTRSAASAGASANSPLLNAVLVGSAAAYASWLLVSRGRVSWPPSELIANTSTLAGCIALVGPPILLRRAGPDSGVGDTVWLTGGFLIWIFNLAALVRGEARLALIPTPITASMMGLVMAAVLVSSWRIRGGNRSWSWTNVTGWALGIFWVGPAFATLLPGNPLRLQL